MRRSGAKVPRSPVNRGSLADLMLALVAIVAVGSVGYFGLAYWLAPRSAPPTSPLPVAAVQSGATTEVAWTDADARRCKAAARAAANAPVPGELALTNPAVTPGFAGLATSIECQLTTKTARFCDPTAKAALVAMINDYLGRLDLVKFGLGLQGAPMVAMGALFGGEISAGSEIYGMGRDATIAFMANYHTRISKRLQALAGDGIVNAGDFGAFFGMGVPGAITEMFAGVEPQRYVCA